jgi:hypothetical protein
MFRSILEVWRVHLAGQIPQDQAGLHERLGTKMWILWGGLCLVALSARIFVFIHFYGYYIDDSYISMRYAENLATGKGLCFSTGERVMGFTSPLYVLLLGLFRFLFAAVDFTSLILVFNLLLWVVFFYLVLRIVRSNFDEPWPILLWVAFYFSYLDASVNGMETTLFITLIFAAMGYLHRSKADWALVFLALLCLTRPEGYLLLGAGLVYWLLVRPSRAPIRGIIAFSIILAVWFVFAYLYYGSILPQSMLAKSQHLATYVSYSDKLTPFGVFCSLAFAVTEHVMNNMPGSGSIGAVIIACASIGLFFLGGYKALRSRSIMIVPGLFFILGWLFYLIGNPSRVFSWYTIPFSLCFFLVVFWTALQLSQKLGPSGPIVGVATCLLMIPVVVFGLPQRARTVHGWASGLGTLGRSLVRIFPQAKSIAMSDIGMVGYITKLRIIDLGGLVSPQLFKDLTPQGYPSLRGIIDKEKPDLLLVHTNPLTNDQIVEAAVHYSTFQSSEEKRVFLERYYQCSTRDPFIFVRRELLPVDGRKPRYDPASGTCRMVDVAGIEPRTSTFQSSRSPN